MYFSDAHELVDWINAGSLVYIRTRPTGSVRCSRYKITPGVSNPVPDTITS